MSNVDASSPHQLTAEQLMVELGSRLDGLDSTEVSERLRKFGSNTIQRMGGRRWWRSLLWKHFFNFFSLLLFVSAALCFLADYLQPGQSMVILGWALACVAVLNGLFAWAQEFRAERAMDELQKFLPHRISVRRNGIEQEIVAPELVPGDILLVKEGDKIPADARLIRCTGLLVNNGPLTGESRPQSLISAANHGRLMDSPNILLAGCTVLRGNGEAVVFATGRATEFGKLAALSEGIERPPSPLERDVNRMSHTLTMLATAMGGLFFIYGLATGQPLLVNLVFMMGIIVANVPEGLLPTLTLALSMGSLRMARRKVLVKSLEAVEALGAIHVICTDKTGTLTLNQLEVVEIVNAFTGSELTDLSQRRRLLQVALIASEVRQSGGAWSGDPLDVAVARAFTSGFGRPHTIVKHTRRHFPFDVLRRRESGILVNHNHAIFACKGAWESLRPLIRHVVDPDESKTLSATNELLNSSDSVVESLASQGYRVIAVAYRDLEGLPAENVTLGELESGLVLLGFLALDDPIRPEIPNAVADCRRAGIRVVMVTGDHPVTAQAVAARIGIVEASAAPPSKLTVHGAELDSATEPELISWIQNGATVFARTTPEQKMKIISAFKRLDHVVAMTGDGVNDAPALKAADVGIAMGLGGTDVAREAADIILLDNNFASIVSGVEEGRAIFRNIQRFTDYVLASNVPEIVPYLLYIVLPVPLALTIIQILAIDLGTDMLPAIGLGQEPPESDVMQRPPRRRDSGLLNWPVLLHAYGFFGVLEAAGALALFFYVLILGGWTYGERLDAADPLYQSATGIALAAIIQMQIANLIGRRSTFGSGLNRGIFANRLIMAGICLEVLFGWAVLFCPPVQTVLSTHRVPMHVWLLSWLSVPIVFVIDYFRKGLARYALQ